MRWWQTALALAGLIAVAAPIAAAASDHLDSSSVIADPRADIADIYGWMSADGARLNLVMTIVGASLAPDIDYLFHIESAAAFGAPAARQTLGCRFASAAEAWCTLGDDEIAGDPRDTKGITSTRGHIRLFAGPRDDPFYNNVRGSRAGYLRAIEALKAGAQFNAAGCPGFTPTQSADIIETWRQTEGGPARNFLAQWTPTAIVVSIAIDAVNRNGPLLAIWGATERGGERIDRAARPLTGNALLATLGTPDEQDTLKRAYNRASPAEAEPFVADIAMGIALYDGFDGQCGNSLLSDEKAPAEHRYWPLATVLADDRLWINTKATRCTRLFAVERAALAGEVDLANDCGGRTPRIDAADIYRSLLAAGDETAISDGVDADEAVHDLEAFPFLADPVADGVYR